MSRNNERNIRKHNDKLHKAQDKAKKAAVARREKLSAIMKKFNDTIPLITMAESFDELKHEVQQVIDLIAAKQYRQAVEKLADAGDLLDDLIDHADDEDNLMELSRYQVLLNHLQQKIHNLD